MSNEKLSKINILAGEFESYADIKDYCNKQFNTIQQISQENQELKQKIEHLEELVQNTTDLKAKEVSRIDYTPEQIICQIQIEKLRSKSFERELTLEETKRLEILIKSLYLIKEKGTAKVSAEFKKLTESLSIENLAEIATSNGPASE